MSTAPSQPRFKPARIIIVMGVSSSGKSAVGAALGRRLHAPFLDGDGYHPPANKEKMRAGIPLVDEDRWPWLETLARALAEAADQKGVAVGACSALKRAYRDYLIEKAEEPILFVFLDGDIEVIRKRIEARHHEFMSPKLLDSQFATLERPGDDENVLRVDVADPVETIATRVAKELTHLKVFKRGQ
ncbi:MAG: gluconokinase [Devosia sp.]|uniref:gluconokinase n=1 Tax=Devosia sp. TaxID=1871048 RepID=UPI001AC84C7C|nr:gluconokinase [Devosia sp.]MBN9316127.1 gluconokinase [Devosia sp.]